MNPLVSIIYQPRRTAGRIKSNPLWFLSFGILAALSIVAMVLTQPHLVQLTLRHLPASATTSEKEAMAAVLRSELWLRSAFLPIRLLFGWATFALMMFQVCNAFFMQEPVRFTQVFGLSVHAEAALVLGKLATSVRALLLPDGSPEAFLSTPISAATFASPSASYLLISLLNSVNIFNLLYVVILTSGISVLYKTKPLNALPIAVLASALMLAFNLALIKLMQETLSLSL